MSSIDQEEHITESDIEQLKQEEVVPKKQKFLNAIASFYHFILKKINDFLDLNGIEEKLPKSIQEKLPENKRLVTLPIFIFAVGLFLILVLAIFAPSASKKKRDLFIPVVRVYEAQQQDLRLPVYSQGVVQPKNEIQLLSLVNGPVIYVSPNLVEGGVVEEGELQLKISDRAYQQDKAKVEANLARAKSAQVAKRSELRVRGTLRTDAGKAQLREVNAAVEAAEADVQKIDDLIEDTEIKAPFSGVIRKTKIQNGQMINAGTLVGSIFSTDTAVLNLPVSDRQLALLSLPKPGEESEHAKVKVIGEFGRDAFQWQGKLVRLAGRNELNRLHYLTVEINDPYGEDPDQPGRPVLSPGFFVRAEIEGKQFSNIIRLPRKALKSNEKIWIVDKENRLKAVDADLLHRGKDYIFVSMGLESGAKVVVSDLEIFATGIEVESIEVEQQTTLQDESGLIETKTTNAPEQADEKEEAGLTETNVEKTAETQEQEETSDQAEVQTPSQTGSAQ